MTNQRRAVQWDDTEFTIRKTATGYAFEVGTTPAYNVETFLNRLTTTDYLLGAAAVGVILLALKR